MGTCAKAREGGIRAMNHFSIQRSFRQMKERGWDKVYWAIDLHDTVFKGDHKPRSVGGEFYPRAKEVLQRLSAREDCSLILWSCSYGPIIKKTIEWFAEHEIKIDYANENPECGNTLTGDFTQKFYFNVLLDDKAGFEGETDWHIVEQELDTIDEASK